MAPTGWAPTADSWLNMMASVPSRIALATSATSARVGRDDVTIESSICVAVITGRACAPASAIRFFCTIGTSSIGSSIPRSPRATITQSATRTISSALSTACGFSILAISGTRVCSRTCSTSSGRRTKLKATMSTPMRRPASRWARSSAGTEGSSSAGLGMFSPWREATVPPTSTSASTSRSPGRTAVARRRTEPSARYMTSPTPRARARPSQEIDMRRASPAPFSPPHSKTTLSPTLSSTVPSTSGPMRSFGPGRSCRSATGRPARPAASRTSCAVSACCSCDPWLKLSRATSMPASIILTSVSALFEAGPIVATILVRRVINRSRYCASAEILHSRMSTRPDQASWTGVGGGRRKQSEGSPLGSPMTAFRSSTPVVLALAALAFGAGTARAADYCVAPATGCTLANTFTASGAGVQSALAAATGASDRVLLGAATYTAPTTSGFVYNHPGLAPEIVGAGAGQTILTGPTDTHSVLYVNTAAAGVLRDVGVRIPLRVAAPGYLIALTIGGGTARGVAITSDPALNGANALELAGGRFEDGSITLPMSGPLAAIGTTGAGGGVRNTTVTAATPINITSDNTTIERVHATAGSGNAVSLRGANARISDSVLVQPGASAAVALSTGNGTSPTMRLDHDTIIGTAGATTGLSIGGTNAGHTATVDVSDSI